jgi:hypothetical protein
LIDPVVSLIFVLSSLPWGSPARILDIASAATLFVLTFTRFAVELFVHGIRQAIELAIGAIIRALNRGESVAPYSLTPDHQTSRHWPWSAVGRFSSVIMHH